MSDKREAAERMIAVLERIQQEAQETNRLLREILGQLKRREAAIQTPGETRTLSPMTAKQRKEAQEGRARMADRERLRARFDGLSASERAEFIREAVKRSCCEYDGRAFWEALWVVMAEREKAYAG